MSRKIRVLGISNQDTAVYLYRIVQPLENIAKLKLASVHHLPIFGQHARHLTTAEFRDYQAMEGKWADVLFTTLGTDRHYLALLLALKERYKLKLVVDLDDDVLGTHLEPNNPAYSAYSEGTGRHAEYAQHCIAEADLVTVSTEYLKTKYAPLHPNIVVVPNCPYRTFYDQDYKEDPVTIGYAGSGSHQKDWEMVEPVLRKLKRTHGIKVKVLGPMVTDVADEQVKWADTLEYPGVMASMGFSIGVAPLKDSAMNRAKSNLRWLEYSSLSIPTVASDVVPFRGPKSILRVSEPEEWEQVLTALVEDQAYRTSLGKAAYTEVREHYDPAVHARGLFRSIERLCVQDPDSSGTGPAS